MRAISRCAAVLAATIAVASVCPSGVTGVALAGPCLRTVGVQPQVSAGEGAGTLRFKVFSGGCDLAGTVGYVLVEGSAEKGVDFQEQSGHLRWEAAETGAKTISVTILRDEVTEADLEDFWVQLVEPGPTVQVVKASGQGRILDDDGSKPLIAVDDSACVAGMPDPDCLCDNVLFQLREYEPNCVDPQLDLSAPQAAPTTVYWRTLDGTAIAGVDYEPVKEGVTQIRAGATSAELYVRLFPKPGAPRRYFYVQLFAVSTGSVVDDRAMIIIHGT